MGALLKIFFQIFGVLVLCRVANFDLDFCIKCPVRILPSR